MEKGDIIKVSFTAKEETSGKIFDTTNEKIARDSGIFKEGAIYRSIPVVVGSGDLIKGLDSELEKMSEGEQRKIVLDPEQAFGERKKELVAVIPLKEFTSRKINPFPGLVVDVDGQYGRVQTVSGGRVRVDFNSELAGKTVEYDLKIDKKLIDTQEQVEALTQKYFPLADAFKPEIKVEGEIVNITLSSELPKELSILEKTLEDKLKEYVKGIKEVKFSRKETKKEEPPKEEKKE